MKRIIEFYKILNDLAKFVIGSAGVLLVISLCMWSIVYLRGGMVDNAQLNLKPLVASPTLAYIWIGTIIIFFISVIVWLVTVIKKGISTALNPQLSVVEKVQSLSWWILKH
ncbi:hypothetical protein LCGC14_0341200 [marine sediment metagenome]|uniref:Uncharacterized protein n=1 Tax=marine sediment metagenome TaxID=412755 RepID=A0A0F9WLA7_9ZZZZ